MDWVTKGAAALMLFGLAACGGGGGAATTGPTTASTVPDPSTDPVAYFKQVVGPGYENFRADLVGDKYTGATGLPNTAFVHMPTKGTAIYKGYALVAVNRNNASPGLPRLSLEGTATLNVDFAKGAASGAATNFVGGASGNLNTVTGAYIFTAPPIAYPGTISITNGCIGIANGCGSVTRPNQLQANFSGTLKGGGNTLVTSGRLLADFKGTPIQGVAVSGDPSIATTINGVAMPNGSSGFFFFVKP